MYAFAVAWTLKTGLSYLFLASFICLLCAAELAFPRERMMAHRDRWRVLTFGAIFIPVQIGVSLALAWLLRGVGAHSLIVGLGWSGLILAAFLTDFLYYWYHRAQHSVPWMWRYHSVHHSIEQMGAGAGYHHLLEAPIKAMFVSVPMLFIIQRAEAPFLVFLLAMHGYYIHSVTKLNFGPLAWLVADNRTHRVHHSLEQKHFDRNFGAFTMLWDRLFGTAYWPGREWPAVGIADQREPRSVREYFTLRQELSRVQIPDDIVRNSGS